MQLISFSLPPFLRVHDKSRTEQSFNILFSTINQGSNTDQEIQPNRLAASVTNRYILGGNAYNSSDARKHWYTGTLKDAKFYCVVSVKLNITCTRKTHCLVKKP